VKSGPRAVRFRAARALTPVASAAAVVVPRAPADDWPAAVAARRDAPAGGTPQDWARGPGDPLSALSLSAIAKATIRTVVSTATLTRGQLRLSEFVQDIGTSSRSGHWNVSTRTCF